MNLVIISERGGAVIFSFGGVVLKGGSCAAVTIHWTGLLDWTTGLTFDLKCSIYVKKVCSIYVKRIILIEHMAFLHKYSIV